MSGETDFLADFCSAMNKLGLRWYLFGAQAAHVYGSRRATDDVDVTVELGHVSRSALLDALAETGFRLDITEPDFLRKTPVFPIVHVATGLDGDVVLAASGLEQSILDRVTHYSLNGVDVPVATVEDMIIMKIFAGRPRDMVDVSIMLPANPQMDVDYVESVLGELEEALAQSDLVAAFHDALGEAMMVIVR